MGPNQRCRTFYRSKFSSSLPISSNPPVTPPLSLPFIKKDPAQPLVAFTKEDYKNAELKCLTKADCSSIYFGFTAESQFYHNGILQVQSTIFSHHLQSLQIMASKYGRNLKIELRYGFFSKLNFEIRLYGQSYYCIKLTVVYTQCPLFYYAEQRPGETFTRYIRFNPQKEDEEGFWEKFVGSTAMQMSFVLDRSNLFSFLDSLSSTALCSILFTPLVDNVFNTYRIDLFLRTEMKDCPWKIRYCIEAIKSCGNVGSFFMDYVLYKKNERVNVKENGILNEAWAFRLFSAMYAYLKSDISLASLDFSPDNHEQRERRDDGFVMIKTVYITPTRKILTVEEATMNSRGFRKLGVDNLIQIKFRDDSLSWFPTDNLLLEDVVKTICRDGVDIAGRKFFEFGGSSSLFREHGSYFYATENKNEIVEKWKTLGEFKVEAAAKVQARIGQYFTSAREIRFKLRLSDVALIDDYMSDCKDSAGQPYCFSDGCGTIDPILARYIAGELQLTYIPSAFQFRFAGFKGMVAVDYIDTRLKSKDGPYFLLLRHSQKKFHVEDDGQLLDLDIVQWSAPTPSKLHGAFISMIDSLAVYNGKQDIVRARLRQLHNQTFVDIIKPLVDKKAFLATLEKLPKYIPVYKLKTKNLLHQPFLRGMIEANAVLNARLLANKSQIVIPSDLGRSAHGIVDTTGSLKEGQVFFQFSSNLNTKSSSAESGNLKRGGFNPVLKLGRVGVTKSPIYHVGDIRYLEAVEAPALMDKVDVLVFPSCGTRPHTDEIGGGDIDGDCYTIFWDPAFLLDFSAQPNDYTAPSVERITKVDLHGLQENAPDIRVKYLKSNNLEQLSTTHLAHLTLHDPLHEDCEKLARKADKAVNFFKSGLEAEELEEYERPGYWPKSMNKTHEPCYTNSHILCELHEKSTSVLHLISIAQSEAQQNREKSGLIDKENIVIAESDMKMFSEYKKDINAIKVRYQVKSEGELFFQCYH
jgi:hypothetical protein